METLSASEAKREFGEVLLKTQALVYTGAMTFSKTEFYTGESKPNGIQL